MKKSNLQIIKSMNQLKQKRLGPIGTDNGLVDKVAIGKNYLFEKKNKKAMLGSGHIKTGNEGYLWNFLIQLEVKYFKKVLGMDIKRWLLV